MRKHSPFASRPANIYVELQLDIDYWKPIKPVSLPAMPQKDALGFLGSSSFATSFLLWA